MEERKTAAWVLGTIALLALFFFVVRPRYKHSGKQTVAYKTCVVHFFPSKEVADEDMYRSAKNRLGLCMCTLYRQKHDSETKDSIMSIFKRYNYDSSRASFTIDSVIKHKYNVFDTTVLVD